jgi:hypothetical protein
MAGRTGGGAVRWRPVHRLTFALSLAVSPGPERAPSIAGVWRDLARAGSTLAYLAMLVGALLASQVVGALVGALVGAGAEATLRVFGQAGSAPAAVINVVIVASLLISAFIMSRLARPAATAFPQRTLKRAPYRLAAITMLPMGAVIAVVNYINPYRFSAAPLFRLDALVGILVGAAAATLVLGAGLAQLARGRRWVGLLLCIGAVLVGSEIAFTLASLRLAAVFGLGAGTGPLWLPLSVLGPGSSIHLGPVITGIRHVDGYSWDGGGAHASYFVTNTQVARLLLLCLTFAVWYARRIMLRGATAPEPSTVAAAPVVPPIGVPLAPRWLRLFSILLGIAGAGIWVYSTALTDYLNPNGRGEANGTMSTPSIPLAGLVIVAAALAIWLSGRGPVVAPVALAVTAMFLAGAVVQRMGWFHSRSIVVHPSWVGVVAAAGLAVVAVAAVVGAWWLARTLALRGANQDTARRTLFVLAVGAALMVPTYLPDSTARFTDTIVVGYLAAALGWLTAVLLVYWCRPRRPALTAMLALLVVPGAIAFYGVPSTRFHAIYGPAPDLMIPLGLAVIVLAATRWDRPRRPFLAGAGWAATLLAVVGLSMAFRDSLYWPGLVVGSVVGHSLGGLSDWSQSGGLLIVGVGVAIVIARWVIPPTAGTRTDEAVIEPEPADPTTGDRLICLGTTGARAVAVCSATAFG